MSGPGTVSGPDASGAFTLALQHAAVAAVRQVLVKCSVAVPAEAGGSARHPVITVAASGRPPGADASAPRTEAEPLTVALAVAAADRPAVSAASEQLAEVQTAVNRETVAAAAAEVASIISAGRDLADAERALSTAEQRLVGDTCAPAATPGSQAAYLTEIRQLRSRMQSEASPAHAYAVTQVLQMQRTIDCSRTSAPQMKMSKYATTKHSEMMSKKRGGGGGGSSGPSGKPMPRQPWP